MYRFPGPLCVPVILFYFIWGGKGHDTMLYVSQDWPHGPVKTKQANVKAQH